MIKLIQATADLRIDKRTYAGCPIILRDGSLDFVPSRWLAHLWSHRRQDTVRSYARQFVPFLTYLEQRRLAWWEVVAEDIEAYQTRMQLAGYLPASNNLSLQSILSFYSWCSTRGFIERAPFIVQARTKSSQLPPSTPVRPARQPQRIPKLIGPRDFDRVLAAIPAANDEVLYRTELTFECGRYMGLRRQEVAGLTCSALSVIPDDDSPVGLLHLDANITKGGRERDVLAPRLLLRRLRRYLTVYRPKTVRRAQERLKRYAEPQNLFLTLSGGTLSREYISSSWNAAARVAGIEARFHSNRHWYGTIIVACAKRLRLADPLREAANLLGHADVSTTMIYDHSSRFIESCDFDEFIADFAWAQHAH